MRATEQQIEAENRERAMAAVRGLSELTDRYQDEGWGADSYAMALAHQCGAHRLSPSYAGKLDELYYREGLTS